jgi:hypothetical protein
MRKESRFRTPVDEVTYRFEVGPNSRVIFYAAFLHGNVEIHPEKDFLAIEPGGGEIFQLHL